MKKVFLLVLFSLYSTANLAASHYLSGNIKNIATSGSALSIMLHNGVPDNCQGVPFGWMRIKKDDTPMVSMALAMWLAGKHKVTVYTKMESGVCYIYSLDPTFDQ
ncbi:hypothetical protein [Aliiglaciecola sp. M165]|uniref:hypothetical protein n=1 Tax=Aliiglaciecola sp. M165 TaxID=2593649 RepID=UPI00117C3B8D|nr:hypothetical protein [Aliiglaciecola sp. M165]TRY33400.1 hypothetical protein FM019_05345 [Aliiglaciecola sp. M165]